MEYPSGQGGAYTFQSNHVFFAPPDSPYHAYGDPGLDELYKPPIFPQFSTKDETPRRSLSVSQYAASSRDTSASPDQGTPQVDKAPKLLIEPPKEEHSHFNEILIGALHPTLKRIVESWSGETRASQERVLNKIIKELDKDSQTTIRFFAHGTAKVDAEAVRRTLSTLCGPKGRLCLVNRNGSQSGVSSIVCAKCEKSFDSNPVQVYAHHLITYHWKIKTFACYAPDCNKLFAWTHDRDRHERSKHYYYRRKAYDIAMNKEAKLEAQVYPQVSNVPPDPEAVYQAFRGYNEWSNTWEA